MVIKCAVYWRRDRNVGLDDNQFSLYCTLLIIHARSDSFGSKCQKRPRLRPQQAHLQSYLLVLQLWQRLVRFVNKLVFFAARRNACAVYAMTISYAYLCVRPSQSKRLKISSNLSPVNYHHSSLLTANIAEKLWRNHPRPWSERKFAILYQYLTVSRK